MSLSVTLQGCFSFALWSIKWGSCGFWNHNRHTKKRKVCSAALISECISTDALLIPPCLLLSFFCFHTAKQQGERNARRPISFQMFLRTSTLTWLWILKKRLGQWKKSKMKRRKFHGTYMMMRTWMKQHKKTCMHFHFHLIKNWSHQADLNSLSLEMKQKQRPLQQVIIFYGLP